MFPGKGCVTFGEFFEAVYHPATVEPIAGRFKELSKNEDREEMIKILLDIPYVKNVTITESYTGKSDSRAAELYDKARKVFSENVDDKRTAESRACGDLTEALFAASAGSKLFLNAVLDCARFAYDLRAFERCLKYCECMLSLSAGLYDKTAEIASFFVECREECARLERDCTDKLKVKSSSQKRKQGKHRSSSGPPESLGNHVATPVVDGKRHAILQSCSDAVVLQLDEKKGRKLVATRNIKAGTTLIVDRPFAFSTDVEAVDRNCLHCHVTLKLNDSVKIPCRHCQTVSFCSEKCYREAWHSYHRYECSIFNLFYEKNSKHPRWQTSHLLLAYRTTVTGALTPNDNRNSGVPFLDEDFLRYHTANTKNTENKNEDIKSNKSNRQSRLGLTDPYEPQDYRTVLELETHCADTEPTINLVRAIEAVFLAKCFTYVLGRMDVVCSNETFLPLAVAMLHHLQGINCNAYEIVENIHDRTTRVWEPRQVGGAIYPTVSLVNHSCYPNVVRHSYPGGTVVVRSLRFIGKGSEILDCYGPQFLSEGRLVRRGYLWKKYHFLCECEACTENWQFPLPETINCKCRKCSGSIDLPAIPQDKSSQVSIKRCPDCGEKNDCKKLDGQLRRSVEKRLQAVDKMYQGDYRDALPLLLEHIHFIEKFFVAPNIETIKTQQCIIQCYNRFGCTSQ